MDFKEFKRVLEHSIHELKKSTHFRASYLKASQAAPDLCYTELDQDKYDILSKFASLPFREFIDWFAKYRNTYEFSTSLEHLYSIFRMMFQLLQKSEESQKSGLTSLNNYLQENFPLDDKNKIITNNDMYDHFTLEVLFNVLCQADKVKTLFGKARKFGGEYRETYTPLILSVLETAPPTDIRIENEVFELHLLTLIRMKLHSKALDVLLQDYEKKGNIINAYRGFTLAMALAVAWKKKKDKLESIGIFLNDATNQQKVNNNKQHKLANSFEEQKDNPDALPFSSYTYSLWIRIAKNNSEAVYKQPKMFQGLLDLCFLSGFYKNIKENLYDNVTLNPFNYYKKREEILYKAKFNFEIGNNAYAFLMLSNWLHKLFHNQDLEGLIFYQKNALEIFEKVSLELNKQGSPSFRLKSITDHIDPQFMPYDPEIVSKKNEQQTSPGRRKMKSKPRDGVFLNRKTSKAREFRIRSLDVSNDPTTRGAAQDRHFTFEDDLDQRGVKPMSETILDKENDTRGEDIKLTHEDFLNMIFCVLLRISVRIKKFYSEEMLKPEFQKLVKRLYLLELTIKTYYEEFVKEGNNELILTLSNLVKAKHVNITYQDIQPFTKYLLPKEYIHLADKVLPHSTKTALTEYNNIKNSSNSPRENLTEKIHEIIRLFMFSNSLKFDERYIKLCRIPKREIYSDILRDMWDFIQLPEIFIETPKDQLADFINRIYSGFVQNFIAPSKKKLEGLVCSNEKGYSQDDNDMDSVQKRNSEIFTRNSITVYEIILQYLLNLYNQKYKVADKQGIFHFAEIYSSAGLQEQLIKNFFEDLINPPPAITNKKDANAAAAAAAAASKSKRKTSLLPLDLAGQFYHVNIPYLFRIPLLHKFSRKIVEDIFGSIESDLLNAKVAPLDSLKYEELGQLLELEDQYLNSYAYTLSQYFYTLGEGILRDLSKDFGTATDHSNTRLTHHSTPDENPHIDKKVLYRFTVQDFFHVFGPKFEFFESLQKVLFQCDHKLEHDPLLLDHKVFGSNIWDFAALYNQMILINIKLANNVIFVKKHLSIPCSLGADYTTLISKIKQMVQDLEAYLHHQYDSKCALSIQTKLMQKREKEKRKNAATSATDEEDDEKNSYLKEWNWLIKFIRSIYEILQVVYMQDAQPLFSLKDENVFKYAIGLSNAMRNIMHLGTEFFQ